MPIARAKIVCSLFLPLAIVSCARADFVVSFDNTTIVPGGTALVNAYIRSTVPAGQTLNNTNFEFLITTSGPTELDFVNSPPPNSDPTFSSVNYVFLADSLDLNSRTPLGSASQFNISNDRFIGGDATLSGLDVLVPNTSLLLGQIPITAVTGLPPAVGDTFTIRLIPGSDSGFNGFTGFGNSSNAYFPFTSSSGSIAAVPEPTSCSLLASGAVGIFLMRLRARAKNTRK